jgi:acyl-CoA synthetase (AMP-forming)/AMP-acid ligase II
MSSFKAMTLREILEQRPLDRLVINDRTVADLTKSAGGIGVSSFRGVRIALHCRDVGRAVAAITLLDGEAEAILLLSVSLARNSAVDLALKTGCQAIVTDRPETLVGDGQLQIISDLAEFSPCGQWSRNLASEGATRWILTTSGTTGIPKLVSHSLKSLTATTKVDLHRGAEFRWGLLYDYTRYAGLQVLLQGLLSGSWVAAPPHELDLKQRISEFAERQCTHLSATPTMWRKIMMLPESERLQLKQITLGGEIADDRVLSALHAKYRQARISHVFASTEAGVGFSVSDGKAGFPISYLTTPPRNIGLLVRDGRLLVQNREVDPAYVNSSDRFVDSEGFIDTGDMVEIQGDRVLFLGRANGVINVGGNKIHPERVERVLLEHEGVELAHVYAQRSSIVGSLVAADLKPQSAITNETAFKDSVQSFCSTRLAPYETPATFRVVKELNLTAAGKLERT